jgi:bacillopeptidase F
MTPRALYTSRTAVLLAALVLGAAPRDARAGSIAADLARELGDRGADRAIPVIVEAEDGLDPAPYAVPDRRGRDNRLLVALRQAAAVSLAPLVRELGAVGAAQVKVLWIRNAVAATVPAAAVPRLAALPGVRTVRLDQVVRAPVALASGAATPEWNLTAIRAPELWSLGHTGSGAVIAGMDTGVDAAHPDLAAGWRGGASGWFDAAAQHATPYDASGHGTRTMGLMVGGAAGGSAIGVAPDARWIAARIFDDAGQGSLSGIHLAFQWLLDPDGDPATLDAPDVVNASWTLAGGTPGACDLEFLPDVRALEAAGIGVVFAAGNDGPAPATSDSPANNPGVLSAGAVDSASQVAAFSSRGPSACDGGVFPAVVAPGVDVWTTDLSYGGLPSYTSASGTSFAAPHVAAAMAVLSVASPAASLDALKAALASAAVDLAPAGADPDSGHGLVDVAAAYGLLPYAGSPPLITSSPPTSTVEGTPYAYGAAATDPEGGPIAFALDAAPAGMSVDAASGAVTWTPAPGQAGTHRVALRATDGDGLSATQRFSVTAAAANRAPVASADAYAATAGVALAVGAPGVLANDADPDGDPLAAVPVAGPSHGSLALRADGSFVYTPAAGYSGADAFSYAASDGPLLSAPATVTLTVVAPNQPPVAVDDAFTAPVRRTTAYAPRVLAVLANDRDPDGSLAAGSVRLASSPSKGGSATVNADGTLSYAPKVKFKGTESFTYDVRDDRGAASNVATVTVKVQ